MGVVVGVDDQEGSLDVGDQTRLVLDIDAELALEGVVDIDGGSEVDEALVVKKRCVERDGGLVPLVGVDFAESGADAVDDALGGDAGLLRRRCWRGGRAWPRSKRGSAGGCGSGSSKAR